MSDIEAMLADARLQSSSSGRSMAAIPPASKEHVALLMQVCSSSVCLCAFPLFVLYVSLSDAGLSLLSASVCVSSVCPHVSFSDAGLLLLCVSVRVSFVCPLCVSI